MFQRIQIYLLALVCGITLARAQTVVTLHDDPFRLYGHSLELGAEGQVYGPARDEGLLYLRTPNGTFSTIGGGGFFDPYDIAIDSQGQFFVPCRSDGKVFVLSPQGTVIASVSMIEPVGIIKELDSDTMIVASFITNSLVKIAPDLSITPFRSGSPLSEPIGLTYDDLGRLYVSNRNSLTIYRVDDDSLTFIANIPAPTSPAVPIQYIGNITFAHGALYCASFTACRIYRVEVTSPHLVTWIAGDVFGSSDGPAFSADFKTPFGICSSLTEDTLFVTDYQSGHLRAIIGLTTSRADQLALEFQLMPNPAGEAIRIEAPFTLQDAKFEICDLSGRVLLVQEQINDLSSAVDIGHLASGMYLARLSQDGRSATKRFLRR